MPSIPQGTIVVTGATGYLGSHLCRILSRYGYRVLALARNRQSAARLVRFAPHTEVVLVKRPSEISDFLNSAQVDGLVHLASPNSATDGHNVEPEIVELARTIAGSVLNSSLRFVVSAGTWWQWNDLGEEVPLNDYANGKSMQQLLIEEAVSQANKNSITVIPNDIYGPVDWRSKLINHLLASALSGGTGKALKLTDGTQQINLIHVEDAATGIFRVIERCMNAYEAPIATYRLCGQDTLSIREIVATFEKLGHRPNVFFDDLGKPFGGRMNPNVPVPPVPGWQSKYRFEAFLQQELTK
ncbi:MAG: NAD(P)-dependent oxidoreductase [Rhizobiaceae bacterium]